MRLAEDAAPIVRVEFGQVLAEQDARSASVSEAPLCLVFEAARFRIAL
jgi:hypothetical protein